MNSPLVTVSGNITTDGTLQLDQQLPLPAGPVLVTVQPVSPPLPNDPFWLRMETLWATQKARGHQPRCVDQVEAERQALREESEQEIRDLDLERIGGVRE